jgi:hypothetical protein
VVFLFDKFEEMMIDEYWFDKVEVAVSYDLCINLKEGLNQLV